MKYTRHWTNQTSPYILIPSYTKYYNQRRESRQKGICSLSNFAFLSARLSSKGEKRMTNFVETSKSRNAKRTYAAIANVADFEAAVQAFAADSTMGLTKKQLSDETYKAKITYFDENSDKKGYVNLYADDKTQYEALVEFLESDLAAEAANGENHGGASRESTEDTWSAKYSCALGEDTFTVTITREYMLINGFENDETLAAVETWADGVDALCGSSA